MADPLPVAPVAASGPLAGTGADAVGLPVADRPGVMTNQPTSESGPADVSADTATLSLPADATAVAAARAVLRERSRHLPEDVMEDAVLIVSELVSNAVQHGLPEILLRVRVDPVAIDVSVLDHGAQLPPAQPVPSDPTAVSGRGLTIVDRLANTWGIEPVHDGIGKTVWAQLRVPDPG